jgi:N-acyl-D-amino-acid deacylase
MPTHFDTLITGARIIDGSGNPWFRGDVAISGDSLAAITPPGQISPRQAAAVISPGADHVVCPGFIDIQSHSIAPLMMDGRCLSKITQGVTTEIMGEAWTPAPVGGRNTTPGTFGSYGGQLAEWEEMARKWSRFGHWLEALTERGVSPNVGSFLGGGTLRRYGMGMEMRSPTSPELAVMRKVMAESMEDGAFGVSYALIYPPDAYTEIDELVAVCEVVSEYNGVYITHIRSEAENILTAMREALEIGERANLPVEIYHLKASGRRNWHLMPQVIEMIDRARTEGLDVTADMYPYVASGTGLSSVLPPWASAEGRFFDNLQDPHMREKIRAAALHPDGSWEAMVANHGPEGVMPVGLHKPENQQYVGRRLSDIAADRGEEWVDTVFHLLLTENQRIGTIYYSMTEPNIQLQLQLPWIKISTDAGGMDPAWASAYGPVHPRAYGSYPRVLGKYVREERILSLEDAIRKMSSAVADRLRLGNRGLLRRGMLADVVVFDPETIGDRATFEDPHQLSIGVEHVFVNGVHVVNDGAHTGATPGRFVKPDQ